MLGNRRIFELMLLILTIAIFFIAGCRISKNIDSVNGVKLLNFQENTLKKFSLIENINKEIIFDKTKLVFVKVFFDVDSITLVYKGDTTLPESSIKVVSSNNRPVSKITNNKISIPPSISVNGTKLHILTVPHNLGLIDQTISVHVYYNNLERVFKLFYPGVNVLSFTNTTMFDIDGKRTDNVEQASVNCIVGIHYILVESKNFDSIKVINSYNSQEITSKTKIGNKTERIQIFHPLPIPREKPVIQYSPDKGTIWVGQ